MSAFLVETFLSSRAAGEAHVAARRAREAAEELASEGVAIAYVRTTLLPDDEMCFHLFEAESRRVVEEASTRARLGRMRIVAVLEMTAEPDLPPPPVG